MSLLITIVIFIVILAVLVLVHEFGHFIVAKAFKIRVDEFAIGFPPRLFSFKKGETEYSLNLVPFGGYVKIYGENPDAEAFIGPDKHRSFVNKPKYVQALVLIAGITFNVLFAWALFSAGYLIGSPKDVENFTSNPNVKNVHLVLLQVSENSPADKAGLEPGSYITSVESNGRKVGGTDVTRENVQEVIQKSDGKPVVFSIQNGSQTKDVAVVPEKGLVKDEQGNDVLAVGINMSLLGQLQLPVHKAIWEGGRDTLNVTQAVAVGLYDFFKQIFIGKPDFSQVTGPVGIVGMVGVASQFGFTYLLSFTALISLNLAVINLLPFPALDGGRLLFVVIEAIMRRPIKAEVANILNSIGFLILIGLMLLVTYKDIARLLFSN